jgi:hypothetical protein
MRRRWMSVLAALLTLALLAGGCDMKKHAITGPAPNGAPLTINEFLASNSNYGADEFGEHDDWIELYNRTDHDINIAGYGITDNLGDHTKYVVPGGSPGETTVPAHGFLLVWCDGQPDQGALHTGFKLSASGEDIGIYEPTGDAVDEMTFGPQNTDVSYGRNPDGGGTWQTFTVPTPGASNAGGSAGSDPVIAGVALDPAVPTAGDPVTVSAQVTDDGSVAGATLFWAVDGGAFAAVVMTHAGDTWSGTIPGQAGGVTVSYYLRALDDEDNATLLPAEAPTTTLHYTVSTGVVPVLWINEFLADNVTGMTDPDGGEHDDWIEIYNPGDTPVDLGGMYVTDDLTDHAKWQIPSTAVASSTVPAHGYLVLWADTQMEQGVVHVNFKLNASGETIGLYTAAGETINEVTFGAQSTDVSQARVPDGSVGWAFLTTPTPGATNGTGTRPRP